MQDLDSYIHHRVPNAPAYQFMGQPLISDQVSKDDIGVVWRELERVLAHGVPGDVVEFGCYVGTTSLFIRRLLDLRDFDRERRLSRHSLMLKHRSLRLRTRREASTAQAPQPVERGFHVYDSFAGLPPKVQQDASAAGADFQAGKLSVSKKEFLQQFRAARLTPPIVHKGWFGELSPADVPARIAFAFLDGDFYESILTSLALVWQRMERGGSVLIDDYQRPELPGVERAIQHFFRGRPAPRLRIEHNIAIIEV